MTIKLTRREKAPPLFLRDLKKGTFFIFEEELLITENLCFKLDPGFVSLTPATSGKVALEQLDKKVFLVDVKIEGQILE